MPRTWVKLWCHNWIHGTLAWDFEDLAERGAWACLLALAGECRQDGIIGAGPGRPYSHEWIGAILRIKLDFLEAFLLKAEAHDMIHENKDGIHIVNWPKYQSEYQRQKPFREQKKAGRLTDEQRTLVKRQNEMRYAYQAKQKELGRDPTPEERDQLEAIVDKELKEDETNA